MTCNLCIFNILYAPQLCWGKQIFKKNVRLSVRAKVKRTTDQNLMLTWYECVTMNPESGQIWVKFDLGR